MRWNKLSDCIIRLHNPQIIRLYNPDCIKRNFDTHTTQTITSSFALTVTQELCDSVGLTIELRELPDLHVVAAIRVTRHSHQLIVIGPIADADHDHVDASFSRLVRGGARRPLVVRPSVRHHHDDVWPVRPVAVRRREHRLVRVAYRRRRVGGAARVRHRVDGVDHRLAWRQRVELKTRLDVARVRDERHATPVVGNVQTTHHVGDEALHQREVLATDAARSVEHERQVEVAGADWKETI